MQDPLLVPALGLAAGIWLSRHSGMGTGEAVSTFAAFAALAWVSHWREAKVLRWLCVCLAAGGAGAWTETAHRRAETPRLNIERGQTALVEGCVVEPVLRDSGRAWFVLELEPGARIRVTAWLRPEDPFPELRYGQRVEVAARIREPRNFGNPGSFDYAGYLARREIFWLASMPSGTQPEVKQGKCGSRWRAVVFAIRAAALGRLKRLFAKDSMASALMAATLLGDATAVEDAWTDVFRRSGTYHTLVISGLHVTTLAAVLFWPLRLCLAGELKGILAAAILVWVYAMVTGATPPAIRAAAGFSVFLCARFFFRRTRVLNALALVAMGVLLLDPGQLWEASFQLSFLSVAAVGGLAAPLLDQYIEPKRAAVRRLADQQPDPRLPASAAALRVELRLLAETLGFVANMPLRRVLPLVEWSLRGWLAIVSLALGSLIMQIVLALPMALFFHRFSFTGITANVLLVPWMSVLVPVGFGTLFTGWQWLLDWNRAMLRGAIAIAQWHADREPPWRISDPPAWLAITLAAVLVGCLLVRGRWRAAIAGLVVPLTALLLWQPFAPALQPGLELTVIDVGQGESLLVVTPEGRTLLVDGGGLPPTREGRKPRLDIGEDVVSNYLWTRGLRRLDAIALTHAHVDHSGGLPALIGNFRPEVLWTGANPDPEVVVRARVAGAAVELLRAPRTFDFGGARIEVLAPLSDSQPGAAVSNNDSLVLRVSYGERSFLLTGDIEQAVEKRLAEQPERVRADVLKLAHHGSRTSSTQPFLEAVRPRFVTLSAGLDNRFGHPHPEVLARLRERGVALLRTDEMGLITLRTDGRRIAMECYRWEAGGRGRAAVFVNHQ